MDDKLDNPFDVLNERLKRIEHLLSAMLLEHQKHRTNQKHRAQDKSIELAIAITGLKKKTIYNLAELNQWISDGKRKTLEELGLIR